MQICHCLTDEIQLQVDRLFGVSKGGVDELWAGISDVSISESSFKSTDDLQPAKPLLSIISDKTLACSMFEIDIYPPLLLVTTRISSVETC